MSTLESIQQQMKDYQPEAQLLKDRVILVTGAGSGIGRSMALAYAKHGATVLLLGRTLTKLETVYDEILAAGGAEPAILPLDLSTATSSEYEQLADVISTQLGRLDGILHNAAMLGPLTPLHMYDPFIWNKVLATNLTAPFMLTQACMSLLRAAPDASIVFTTSSVGRHARAFWGAYAVSKHGLESMCSLFAAEVANVESIRFNCLNPGATRTNMRAQAYPGENPDNLPTPDSITLPFLYLMGVDSRGVTGRSLDVTPK